MIEKVRMAFEQEGIILRLDRILPRKQLKRGQTSTSRYQRIISSIKVVGIIEPLLVFPQNGRDGDYILLDGHIRLEALKELGETETFCLIATDDEAFTYNHHVCTMNPIQEHFMISRAVDSGVSAARIAQILCLDVSTIRKKQCLLKGVCDEAVELLKDKSITKGALRELCRTIPMRQIEMAELMVAANNFTVSYAKCLAAGTPVDELIEPEKPNPKRQFTAEDLAKIEREMKAIGGDMRSLEETHGRNVLNLVIVVSYLKKLLSNANVVKYLARKHSDLLAQFQQLVDATSLGGGTGESAG